MLQNGGGYCLGAAEFGNDTTVSGCPGIYRETLVNICCCGNHWNRSQCSSNFQCQIIGTADVARKDGYDEFSQFVNRNHRRVSGLVPDMGSNLPDGDSRATHKHHGIHIMEYRSIKEFGWTADGRKSRFCKPLHGVGLYLVACKMCHDSPCHSAALTAVGKNSDFHSLASRNSVVKPGWYRRLLTYLSPMQLPTMMRLVFVRPFSVTVIWRVSTVQRKIFSSGQVAL